MKTTPIPVQNCEKRLKNFSEVELGFSKKIAVDEARLFPQSSSPGRQPRCPLGIDILGFVRCLREGEISAAYDKIREKNELPGVCGRVCSAPCEEDFIIGGKQMEVDVRALERFAAVHGRPRLFRRKQYEQQGAMVAVVGSGPAGLSAAACLARSGFRVTVFESLPQLGGMLRYGVAGFRLSKDILNAEIEMIRDLGVQFQANCCIGRTVTLEELYQQGFAAVLLAVGRQYPAPLKDQGTDAHHVICASEVLLKLGASEENFIREFQHRLGHTIVVIGDHELALDCARACRRLKDKKVKLVFARTEEDLLCHRNEIEQAKAEGVEFEAMMHFQKVCLSDDGDVCGIQCGRMDYADQDGQWRLMPVPDSQVVVEADTVIMTRGQTVNQDIFKISSFAKLTREGFLAVDPETSRVHDNIFAAGHAVMAQDGIVYAMRSGVHAAEKIIEFLSGGS